ncbi:MAG: DUF2630 family protein [Actinobacteria bacterium]|nr:DUF2630 family protein [Actinomycetota bacterium]
MDRIGELVTEEHALRERHQSGEPLTDEERERLDHLEARLDQCWDLMRQRRARRQYDEDPDEARPRSPETVEHYLQ